METMHPLLPVGADPDAKALGSRPFISPPRKVNWRRTVIRIYVMRVKADASHLHVPCRVGGSKMRYMMYKKKCATTKQPQPPFLAHDRGRSRTVL